MQTEEEKLKKLYAIMEANMFRGKLPTALWREKGVFGYTGLDKQATSVDNLQKLVKRSQDSIKYLQNGDKIVDFFAKISQKIR